MKKKSTYINVLIFIVFALLGCKDEEVILQVPEVTTFPVSDIAYQSATCGGYVNSVGAAITSRGICWSTKPKPSIADNKSAVDNENGSFTISINNLKSDSIYYIRAYATNSVGTGYGSTIQFKTKRGSINVITATISDISYQSATCGGSVTCDGTFITACGICWSTSATPTLSDSTTHEGNETGSFTSIMTSLKPDLTYYVRAYAINDVDTVYGSIMKFKTKRASIFVVTKQANTILHNSAVCGGTVTSSNGVTILTQGVCWSLLPSPTIEDYNTKITSTTNIYDVTLSNLQPNTLYYVRAYASSYNELIYGDNIVFKTRQTALSVSAPTLSNVTTSTVDYSGTITSEQPMLITNRGVCWSTSSIPTIEDNKSTDGVGTGNYTGTIRGLNASTIYYVRTYVTDIEGTVYGDVAVFKTNDLPIIGLPSVNTISVVKTSAYNAKVQGEITSEGDAAITSYGYYCSISPIPVESNSKTWGYNTGTAATFSMNIYSLTSGVKYYIRAFAKNSLGTGYGNVVEYVH